MSDNRIEEIKARRAAITPGEWKYEEYYEYVMADSKTIVECNTGTFDENTADGLFVAAAPADIDYLLAELARVQAECAALKAERDDLDSFVEGEYGTTYNAPDI